MVAANFKKAYDIIGKYEGGKVNDPRDPGGRTNRGITQRVYDAYRRLKGKKVQTVYNISEVEVHEIYKTQYWDEANCDKLPSGVDLVVYDTSVNSGVSRAGKILQQSLVSRGNNIKVDGNIGMATIDAAKDDDDHDMLIEDFAKRRQAFYRGLSTFKTFGKGWTKRNKNCKEIAQAWASGSVGPDPVAPSFVGMTGAPKASDDKIKSSKVTPAAGGALTLAGAGGDQATKAVTNEVTGNPVMDLQDPVTTATDTLSPLVDALDIIRWIFIGLTVIGACLTIYAGYWTWKNRQIRDNKEVTEVPGDVDGS